MNLPQLKIATTEISAMRSYFGSNLISTTWLDGIDAGDNFGTTSWALKGHVDLKERFAEMAREMTDYVRSRPNTRSAFGHRKENRVYVSIKWFWLIGPAAMEIASLVLSTITIIRQKRQSWIPLWKTSALAVLIHELDRNNGLIASRIKSVEEVEDISTGSIMRLS